MPTGNNEGFDDDDIKDLEIIFNNIEKESETNYVIEFHISKLSAWEMIDEWVKAKGGDKKALRACMENYSYICENILTEITLSD